MSEGSGPTVTVADAVVAALRTAGVDVVFGMPGVHTLPLYDALARQGAPRHVLVRHEQAAAFAADGYARTANRAGVALTTTGPGAFNTMAALGEAYADSSAVVLLAGQIRSTDIGLERGLLHEVRDQASAFESVTKRVWRPRTPRDVVADVAAALADVTRGRHRPVYVELPVDLLDRDVEDPPAARGESAPVEPDGEAVRHAGSLLHTARRPVIIAGAGVNRGAANCILLSLAERLDSPVLTSVNGLGAVASSHPLAAGTLIRRNTGARRLLSDADVVIVAGCRLDANTTDDWSIPLHNLIHVDVDPFVLGLNYRPAVSVAGSVRLALERLVDAIPPRESGSDGSARAAVARRDLVESLGVTTPPELRAMREIRQFVPPETILSMDACQMSGWASTFWPVERPAGLLFPFGSATLGFALPAAIGAALADPRAPVIAMAGDGGLLFCVAELATVVEQKLGIVTVVFNNRALGSIRDEQVGRYGRTLGSEWQTPDFVLLARAFGMEARRIDALEDLPRAVSRAIDLSRPMLLEVSAAHRSPWSYLPSGAPVQ